MGASSIHEGGTVGDLIADAIQRYPDRIAFIADGKEISYRTLGERISQAIQLFDSLGLRPGDAVAQLSGNRPDLFCMVAAAYIGGLRSVTLHAAASASDHAHILRDSGAKLLVAEDYHAGTVAALKAEIGDGIAWFSHDDTAGLRSLWHEAEQFRPAPLLVRSTPSGVIRLAYTGGTTGRSKGVMLTNRSLLTNTMSWLAAFPWPDADRFLCVAPMSHGAGSMLLPVLLRGGTTVLHRGFDAGRFVEAIHEHGIGTTWLVPTMLYAFLDHPDAQKADLSSLHTVVYSAAPAAPTRIAQAVELLGPKLVQAYGQTEAPNTILILNHHDHRDAPPGRFQSAGRPSPGIDVALLDDDCQPVASGEVGEVCVRGPLVMDGYWNQPEQTAEALRGGWLHTGDMAYRDEDGFIFIVDRKKDMVITGGFNVYPREVEDVLATHPDVAAAAVFGVPDDKWGEAVTAVVVPRPGRTIAVADLMTLVRTSKGPVHTPKILQIVDALPLTPLGKPDKKALRQRFASGGAPPVT
ncbi:MAG: AMP-binding protein [Mesorhizobium sp.]